MAYRHHPGDVYTRQGRAATAPGPTQPSFPRDAAIPPSLIPGYRHRQTISVTSGVDGLLFPQPDRGTRSERSKVSATVSPVSGKPEYYYVSPSPYGGILAPTPPPPPLPRQAAVPPLPPKAPIISPSKSPILPPKPPPFLPSIPFHHPPTPRSKSQPPPPLPRGASPPFNSPPPLPPPTLPPKPHVGRSTSAIVAPSYLRLPSPMPRERALSSTSDAASLILPSLSSPAASPIEPPVANEEEELELALKLSAHAEKEYADSLVSQDEELARALEESLLDSARPRHAKQQLSRATTTERDRLPSSSSTRPLDTHPYSPKQPPPFPLPVRADSSTSLASFASGQLKEDEAYARKLAAEAGYESGRSTPSIVSNYKVDHMEDCQLPCYADAVKDTGTYTQGGTIKGLPQATPHLESETKGHVRHTSPIPTSDKRDTAPPRTITPVPPQQPSSSSQRSSPRPASLALSLSPSEEEEDPESPSSPRASRAIANPNQFVEPELLYGVCEC